MVKWKTLTKERQEKIIPFQKNKSIGKIKNNKNLIIVFCLGCIYTCFSPMQNRTRYSTRKKSHGVTKVKFKWQTHKNMGKIERKEEKRKPKRCISRTRIWEKNVLSLFDHPSHPNNKRFWTQIKNKKRFFISVVNLTNHVSLSCQSIITETREKGNISFVFLLFSDVNNNKKVKRLQSISTLLDAKINIDHVAWLDNLHLVATTSTNNQQLPTL